MVAKVHDIQMNDVNGILPNQKKTDDKQWLRSRKNVWLGTLFCGCAALYACRTTMPITIVAITKELEWSKTDAGSVLSCFFWGYSLTQVIGGYLSDRFGGEFVIMSAAIGWSVITFWTPQIVRTFDDHSVTLTFVILSRVLMGLCQGMHFPSVTSLSSQRLPDEDRTSFFSTVSAGVHLGTIFSGSIGSYVLESYGWPSVFHVTGVFAISWVLFLKYFVIERQISLSALKSTTDSQSQQQICPARTSVPWLILFRSSGFWAMIISHICETNSTHILISWLPTYFHENFPGSKGWVFNVVPWIICIPFSILGGWTAENLIRKGFTVTFVRKLMETLAQLGKAFFLLLIGSVQSFEAALFCMTFALAAGSFHNCAVFINPQDIAPKYAGSVFGLMNMAGAIPGFIGVYLAGHILEVTGSWIAVFNITAIVNVVGAVVYVCFGTGRCIVP
uniref:Major facilitator superfamily (MFS) profile domain-containing protein n=1 Tax=Strigamia maritima TaxID=126957 RepID=T1IKV8_STRMM